MNRENKRIKYQKNYYKFEGYSLHHFKHCRYHINHRSDEHFS